MLARRAGPSGASPLLAAVAVAVTCLHLPTVVLRALLLLALLLHLLALAVLHLPLLFLLVALLLLHLPLLRLRGALLLLCLLALHGLLALLLLRLPVLLLHLALLFHLLTLGGLRLPLLGFLRLALLGLLHLPLLLEALALHLLPLPLLLGHLALALHLLTLLLGGLALLVHLLALRVPGLALLLHLLALRVPGLALLLHLLALRVPGLALLLHLLALRVLRLALAAFLHLALLGVLGLALLRLLHLPLLLEALALHVLRLPRRIGAILPVCPLALLRALLFLLAPRHRLLLLALQFARLLLFALHGLRLALRIGLAGEPARVVGTRALSTAIAAPAVRALKRALRRVRATGARRLLARGQGCLAHAHVWHGLRLAPRASGASRPLLRRAAPCRTRPRDDTALAGEAPGQVIGGRPSRRARRDRLALEARARLRRQLPPRRGADQAALDRRHRRATASLAGRQVAPFGAMHAAHRASLDEIARRHAGNGARHVAVGIRRGPPPVAPHEVVDGDAVDARDIAGTGAVRRPVGVARTQRVPRHAGTAAHVHAAPAMSAAAADKGDHRRRVARPHTRARHPAPARAHIGPAPVMRGSEAPWRIVDPGPAPRRDPRPVADAVGCPARADDAREPDRAVGGLFLPVAVVVQRRVAGHFARQVARRRRRVFARVTCRGPAVEAVFGNGAAAGVGQVGAGKAHAVAALQFDRAAVAVDHGAAMPHRHRGGAAVRGHVEPVVARLARHEGQVGRIDLDGLVLRQRAHAHLQRALRQLDLRGVVVQVQDAGRGGTAHAHGDGAGMQLGAAAGVHPQPVAGSDRAVQAGGGPLVRTGRRKAQVAFDRGERGDAGGRIGLRDRGVGHGRIQVRLAGCRHLGQCSRRHRQGRRGGERGERDHGGPARAGSPAGSPAGSRAGIVAVNGIGHGLRGKPMAERHPVVTIHCRERRRHGLAVALCKLVFRHAARGRAGRTGTRQARGGQAGRWRSPGGAQRRCRRQRWKQLLGRSGRSAASRLAADAAVRSAGRPASAGRTGSPGPRSSRWPAGSRAARWSRRPRQPRRCAGSCPR
ncbi:conserved membrane hypothetical protein [Cupriavidus oxalaticus]|uniref:Uncharacterized protein n=1 Tax=Cupriavidus oxalaticus TaxID=96344 RepID=A0A375GP68_9BURK|nr:conserved membrane hypothetical protein [Cupriavidus oxalaticus]